MNIKKLMKLLWISSLMIMLIGCDTDNEDFYNKQDKDGKVKAYNTRTGKLYNGKFEVMNRNNQPLESGYFKDGLLHGEYIEYVDGKISKIENYKKGIRNGATEIINLYTGSKFVGQNKDGYLEGKGHMVSPEGKKYNKMSFKGGRPYGKIEDVIISSERYTITKANLVHMNDSESGLAYFAVFDDGIGPYPENVRDMAFDGDLKYINNKTGAKYSFTEEKDNSVHYTVISKEGKILTDMIMSVDRKEKKVYYKKGFTITTNSLSVSKQVLDGADHKYEMKTPLDTTKWSPDRIKYGNEFYEGTSVETIFYLNNKIFTVTTMTLKDSDETFATENQMNGHLLGNQELSIIKQYFLDGLETTEPYVYDYLSEEIKKRGIK